MKKLILLSLLTGVFTSCSKPPPERMVVAPAQQPIAPPQRQRIFRTWTFAEDGKANILSGGAMSFRKGGRMDADFIRVDGASVVLKRLDGVNCVISVSSLSEPDQSVIQSAANVVINEYPLNAEANWRKAGLAANGRAIAAEQAREEARQSAIRMLDEKAKAEAESLEQSRKAQEPPPYYPPAVRGAWPTQTVPKR